MGCKGNKKYWNAENKKEKVSKPHLCSSTNQQSLPNGKLWKESRIYRLLPYFVAVGRLSKSRYLILGEAI